MMRSKPLERDIEAKVCDYAKERGMLVYKFTSPQRSSVPDRLFITPDGRVFFIEFKRGGEMPTPAQLREHQRLQGHNVSVFVVDNVVLGMGVIEEMLMK
ncbi:MAG: PDDEXK family nuclease [Sulfobacillus sp.]